MPWGSVACPGHAGGTTHTQGFRLTHALLLCCMFYSLTKAERAQWQSDLLGRSLAGPEERQAWGKGSLAGVQSVQRPQGENSLHHGGRLGGSGTDVPSSVQCVPGQG